jgi:hypothetical protein
MKYEIEKSDILKYLRENKNNDSISYIIWDSVLNDKKIYEITKDLLFLNRNYIKTNISKEQLLDIIERLV